MKTLLIFTLSLVFTTLSSCQEQRTVKCTVLNEDGSPVQGANVHVGFIGQTPNKSMSIKGISNPAGVFTAKGIAPLRMKIMLSKDGYYPSVVNDLSKLKDHDIKVILRQKKKSIALYAKRYRGIVPGLNEKYGFDLIKSDWVAPHGKGLNSDIFLSVGFSRSDEGEPVGRLELTFPNDQDGVIEVNEKNGYLKGSELLMPNSAFKETYDLKKIVRMESGYQNLNKPKNTSYFLRLQSNLNESGEHKYHYCKLIDGIDFMMSGGVFMSEESRKRHPKELGVVTFTYYFNPTPNDRNLEFDPRRNLFKNLKSTEEVRTP